MKRKFSILFIITGTILFFFSIVLKVISGSFQNLGMMLLYFLLVGAISVYMLNKYVLTSYNPPIDVDEDEYEKLLKHYEEKYKDMD